MPNIETQTEEFIILTDEYFNKLNKTEQQIYKLELKAYNRANKALIALEKRRAYDRNRSKMKLRWNPIYREQKRVYCEEYNRDKKEFNKNKKELKKLLKNNILSINNNNIQNEK
jgi:uncharacterized transporter YbjL